MSRRIRDRLPGAVWALFSALLAFAPGAAEACAVCFSGRTDETRVAFIVTTAFMTFLPLMLLGGIGWWLWRRIHVLESQADAARAANPTRNSSPAL